MNFGTFSEMSSDKKKIGESKKVLIVDDEEGILKFLTRALQLSGFEVQTAESADKAMEILIEGGVNLVLTDIKMPGGSGFDLMMLSKISGQGVPVILMSGHVDKDEMIKQGMNRGAVGCLNKPFTIQDLRNTIIEVLENNDKMGADSKSELDLLLEEESE